MNAVYLDNGGTNKAYDVSLLTAHSHEVVIRARRIVILGFAVCLDEGLSGQVDDVFEASV